MESRVEVDHDGERATLRVSGDLDLSTAPVFRSAVVAAVGDGATELVVDLTTADHLDSVGVGLILGALKRVRVHGGRVAVVCDEPRLLKVIELTDLHRIIPVVEDVGEAFGTGETPDPTSTASGE